MLNLKLNLCRPTVQRGLNSRGLVSCLHKIKPLYNGVNKQKRLAFAKTHINNSQTFLKVMLWSDKREFQIFSSKKQQRVWRKPCDALLDRNLKRTVKHEGGSLMVWRCFFSNGLGRLVNIEGKMTGQIYVDLFSKNFYFDPLRYLDRKLSFQQNNDLIHTFCVYTNWHNKSSE